MNDELPPRNPMTPQQIAAAEYAKMNDDEKRRFNLKRSQRSEPTGTIAPLPTYSPMMRNGITAKAPSAAAPPSPHQQQQQQQTQDDEPLQRYDTPVASDGAGGGGGGGLVVGVVVGLGVAAALYFGAMRFVGWAAKQGQQAAASTAYSAQSQMVAMVPH